MEKYNVNEKHVESYQSPDSVYSQKYDQQTLKYVERQKDIRTKEANQIKKQEYKGRYS